MRTHLPMALLFALTLAACDETPHPPPVDEVIEPPRLVLRDSSAAQLGVGATTLPEVPLARVPAPARQAAATLRDELRGAADSVRFFSADGATFVALIPTHPFEGEDPHVLATFDAAGGRPTRVVLPTFMHVELYCPAGRGAPDAASSARDSANGCRYFAPPLPPPEEPAP